MNNEIVTYSVLKKYVTGNCKSTFISLIGGTFYLDFVIVFPKKGG